jgi:uncharacterized membrane protein
MKTEPQNTFRFFSEHHQEQRRKIFKSIKAKFDSKRTLTEKIADNMSSFFGSNIFLTFNSLFFLFWILINTNNIQGIEAFDPFPFILLTTIVSLEAIFLSIFVLIAQNRSNKIDDLREEIHLQLNFIVEREITKLMKMTSILLEKQGIDISEDKEFKKMMHPVTEEEIQRSLEKEIM